MRIRGYIFSASEFAGALGDFGPLNPFLIAYVAVLGVEPTGLFLTMGLANIVIGIIYNTPLSVEAMKAIGAVALAERWRPSRLYAVGLGTGLFWIFIAFSGLIHRIARATPRCVVRGVQLSLAITLGLESLRLSAMNPSLSIFSVVVALILLKVRRVGRYLPAAIFLFSLGLLYALSPDVVSRLRVDLRLPGLHTPSPQEVASTMVSVGFAQIFLTLGNSVIATAALCRSYFPERKVEERGLALNMGVLNAVTPFFGGVPMCHGAGGVASQYLFGARSGGAMILEGVVEVVLGLFFAGSVVTVFSNFPQPVLGAMLLLTAVELGRVSIDVRRRRAILIIAVVILVSYISNLGAGFVVGFLLHYAAERIRGGRKSTETSGRPKEGD